MLPVFAIMVIFIPANNQIFGFLDGFSAFFFGLILWFLSFKKRYQRVLFVRPQALNNKITE